jgi:hypothetical protein
MSDDRDATIKEFGEVISMAASQLGRLLKNDMNWGHDPLKT